ncbi:MAG: tetratricopeptide repeat protein [Acidobacteriota bacterium]|nr:tetratricopeptide repeat protein [Acidobacteriota bacterium]MDH3522556.1 tetratricopeptide repeat protein [Acidobacteriota bacterium]
MRFRTFASILFALAVVVTVSYLSSQNEELLSRRFALTAATSVPLYGVLIAVFLFGFLPAVSVLLKESLQRDLQDRRERRLDRQAKSLRGSFRRALDFRTDGQWAKALAELEALQKERPENFGTLLYYGEALRKLGRADDAIEVHRRLTVLYPQGVSALYQLAKDYEARGDGEVAEQIYERVLRDFPGQGLSILRRRRDGALRERDWERAGRLQEQVDALLQEGGGTSDAREERIRRGLEYEAAVACLAAERLPEAARKIEALLAAAPDFLPARILQGEVLLAGGDEAAAVAGWRRSFFESGRPVFLQRIEDHFIERENPMQAIETLHELMAAAPNDLLPRFFLGRLYYRLEMHDEAHRILTGLAERLRSSPTYHYLMGRIHERRGAPTLAVESYRTSLRQSGIRVAEYVCGDCGERRADWADRCDACGCWNVMDLDFEEEQISPEQLGIHERPVWSPAEPATGR